MSGLMNSYFYGKAGQADYTVDKMPATRLELFFSVLKTRLSGMVGLNFIKVLFMVPLFAWLMLNISLMFNFSTQYMENVAPIDQQIEEMAFTELSEDEYLALDETAKLEYDTKLNTIKELAASRSALSLELKSSFIGYTNIFLLVAIPLFMLSAVGNTGYIYVLRNWARDDHSFVASDFKDAVKQNWKQALVIGLLNGLIMFLGFICFTWYGNMAETNAIFAIPRALIVLILVLWWFVNMLIFPMMVTYDMNIKTLIRNSFIMALGRLPFTVLNKLATFVLPVVIFVVCVLIKQEMIGILLLVLYYLVFGFAFNGLIYASFSNACFDKFLNPKIEGAAVNKGLRPEGYDDEEDLELTLDGRTLEEKEQDERKNG